MISPVPMRIRIILLGKIREPFLKDGVREYLKRLNHYAEVQLVQLADEPVPEKLSEKELSAARQTEARRLFRALKEDDYVVAMDIEGKAMSSLDFSRWLEERALSGESSLAFVIGSTTGLDSSVKEKASFRMSLGPMTFPHQFMPLLMGEQLYRALKINAGECYHR